MFVPMSLGEATRKQAFGSAMHGWIIAGAVDLMPLLCLIIAFILSREVWHNEQVPHRRLTKQERDAADREALISMRRGGDKPSNVHPFKDAAE